MDKGRMEAFSDGVIAIIITIMVLGIAAPDGTGLSDLLGLLPATLAALRALGRHRLPDLLALGGRGGLAGGLWLFGGRFLRRLLLVGVGEDHLDAGDRIVLRQVFKDQRELLICQRLHVVFGSLGVFRQDLRDGLGGKAEILRHLMDSVFLNTQ